MKAFLNLSVAVINKLHITEISKRTPCKYTIYMNPVNSYGFWLVGTGFFSTKYNKIEICQNTNPNDYKQITDLLNGREDN